MTLPLQGSILHVTKKITAKAPGRRKPAGGFTVPAGRTSATEPAQIVLFTLLLGRFTQVCFQNAVKCGIIKIL